MLHVPMPFMGGGKALINAYYRSAQELGIEILYNTKIKDLKLNQGHFEAAIAEDGRVFKAKAVYWPQAVLSQI